MFVIKQAACCIAIVENVEKERDVIEQFKEIGSVVCMYILSIKVACSNA